MIEKLYLFALFFLIEVIITKTTSIILNEERKRLFLSAFLMSILVVFSSVFLFSKIGFVFYCLGVSVWCVCLSFDFCSLKKFLRIFSTFALTTIFYLGANYFLTNYIGIKSTFAVFAGIVVLFMLVKYVSKGLKRKKMIEVFCKEIEIVNGGVATKWKAFLDSGNLLFDPLTDKPVNLINWRVFCHIFGEEIKLEDVLKKTQKLKALQFYHYIAFNTLNKTDSILVFQVDALKIDGKTQKNVTLGLSLKNFNQTFGSDVILHNNYATEWGLE